MQSSASPFPARFRRFDVLQVPVGSGEGQRGKSKPLRVLVRNLGWDNLLSGGLSPSCSIPSQAHGSTNPAAYEILNSSSNFLNAITTPSPFEWLKRDRVSFEWGRFLRWHLRARLAAILGMLQWPGKGDGMLGASCRGPRGAHLSRFLLCLLLKL